MTRIALAISTFFGCGYFRNGPGTAGSAAGILVAWLLHKYAEFGPTQILVLGLILLWPAIWASTRTERYLKKTDPGMVVIDEVLGQWLTLAGAAVWNWKAYLAAFLLFRLFDIWKPQPARWAEGLPGGTGIVLDDLVAGLYGALILYLGGLLKIY